MSRKRKYRCACGHSLAFHNPDDGHCYARVREPKGHKDERDWSATTNVFDRMVFYEEVDCRCQQYVGRRPKNHVAPAVPANTRNERIAS